MYNQFPYYSLNPSNYGAFNIKPGAAGLLGLSKKAFNWDSFLNNAQRTLNVINQAIPVYNQVKPVFRNVGTLFKVMGELNSAPSITSTAASISNTPQFFA